MYTAEFKGGKLDGQKRPLGDSAPSLMQVIDGWYATGDVEIKGAETYALTGVFDERVVYEAVI